MLHCHEITPGRGNFHSCHGDSRHPGYGFDHPRTAQANSRFSWGRDDRRSEMERSLRSRLRADAVFLFTLARGFVRSIWKTADHPALQSRSRIGLHRYGDGTHVELAFPRANYFRNHDFKYSDGYGIYRHRHTESIASWSVRLSRGRIRHLVHMRHCNWRINMWCLSDTRALTK